MEENMFKQAMNFLRQQKKRKNWHKVVSILAAIVVFVTTYALILPAITLEKPTYCGKEEHRHSEACFTQKLICEKSTEKLIPEDTHTEESSENEKILSCGLEESEGHTHTDEYYTGVDTLIGNQEEQKDTVTTVPAHTHTDECYEEVLNCDLEEHTHNSDCYVDDSIEKVAQKAAEATTEKTVDEVTEETTKQTIEASTDENVQEATEKSTDEDIQETTEKSTDEIAQETQLLTMTDVGADYTVAVHYTKEAEIPENAKLQVHEIDQDSDDFKKELEKANIALQKNSSEYIQKARFFDISIMDEQGNEIQPKVAVDVKIILSDGNQTAENLIVTHTNDAGTDVVENVEATESNGDVIASFETNGFSAYGVTQTTQTEPAEIAVGGTVTLEGTNESYHSWISSDTNVVTVSGSASTATVKGITASDNIVIITHTYGKNKSKTDKEYFYVKVTDKAPDEGTDDSILTNEKTGYIVTVKGNKKILQNAELFVDEIQVSDNIDYYSQMVGDIDSSLSKDVEDKDKVFDFLKMYHIYLSKDGGVTEYDPAEDETLKNTNINLQVTITYDSTPEGWPSQNGNLYIGHYKKNASGSVENKGFTDSTGVKQVKVSGNSITFHIKGFSVITASALANPENTSSNTSNGVELQYSSGTLSADDINGYDSSGQNSWAISTVGAYQSVNGTRIVKYVEPTNIEDIFKVTVVVERTATDVDLKKIIEAMPAYIINENKNKVDSAVGTILAPKEYQNGDCYGSTDESKALDTQDYFYVHYQYSFTENGETVVKDLGNVKMYRAYGKSSGNNHGIVGILPNGKWIVIDTKDFKWGDHGTHNVSLSQAQYEAFVDAATPKVSVEGVIDYLDTNRFIYLGTAATDTKQTSGELPTVSLSNTEASVPAENGMITWSGNGWSNLAVSDEAKMSYYIRLKTSTLDGASTDIYPMSFGENGPVSGSGTAYELYSEKTVANVVAQQAVIENNTIDQKTTDCIIETSQPSVKGLLYYIQLEKVDSEDKDIKLENAEFDVYQGKIEKTDETITVDKYEAEIVNKLEKVATITTNEYGKGISSPGLPWGTYTLIEKTAPSGYSKTWEPKAYNLAYLGNPTSGDEYVADVVGDDKPGKNLTGDDAITNVPVKLKLVKEDSSGNPLSGVEFNLYKNDNTTLLYKGLKSDADGNISYSYVTQEGETETISEFPLRKDTIYYLEETEELQGFKKLDEKIKITIDTATNPAIVNATLENTTSKGFTVTSPTEKEKDYVLTITNSRKEIPITLVKVGMDNGETDISKAENLSGAQFELYKVEGDKRENLTNTKLIASSADITGVFSVDGMKLEDGTYILKEIKAPDSYNQIINELSFIINTDATNSDKIITTSGSSAYLDFSKDQSDDETIYTIKVINRAGVKLPETGGTGTLPYTFGGLGLILISIFMYGYSMRRK